MQGRKAAMYVPKTKYKLFKQVLGNLLIWKVKYISQYVNIMKFRRAIY